MTNLERDQLLSTVPEVGFEIAITLVCSWNIALHIYCFYLHAIEVSGYGAKKVITNTCDVTVAYITR